MLHGVERYVIDGVLVEGSLIPSAALSAEAAIVGDPLMTPEKRQVAPKRLFCRLFPAAPSQPDIDALTTLGLAMETEKPGVPAPDTSIAAGFTYLGQFIDHDITFDQTQLTIGGFADPNTTVNHRTPALDLDSVYGGGPAARPDLYETDGVTLRIGMCTASADNAGTPIPAMPHDLPRVDLRAVIGDPRNDENLALAQLHLAFIKFHNSFVREIRAANPALDSERLFARAREATIKHYQRIVLTEFLPRIIDPNALEFVLSKGHRFFKPDQHDLMPIEFSVAAFRLGHSMIRPDYEWNRVFNSKGGPAVIAQATLKLLFEFTQFSGSEAPGNSPFFGAPTLPSNWIVDWRMMFDVVGNPPAAGFSVNRARHINTQLTLDLKTLPEFAGAGVTDERLLSLASRNLLRGRLVNLPDGLTVAAAISAGGLPHDALTEAQLRDGPHGPTLAKVGLLDKPPLWYYILREGELRDGETLGPVGSAIIAETIVAHIRKADVSVLADTSINQIQDIPRYTMSDLLNRIGDLNPIG
jgi:Animal haem peroxidase